MLFVLHVSPLFSSFSSRIFSSSSDRDRPLRGLPRDHRRRPRECDRDCDRDRPLRRLPRDRRHRPRSRHGGATATSDAGDRETASGDSGAGAGSPAAGAGGVSRSWSAARDIGSSLSIPFVIGCAPPSTRRAVRSVSSSVATASRRSSSVAPLSL